jgi:class 3 adenylate cyclase
VTGAAGLRDRKRGWGTAELDRSANDAGTQVAGLCDVIGAAHSPGSLEQVLGTVLDHSARLCKAQGGSIHVDEGDDSYRALARFGIASDEDRMQGHPQEGAWLESFVQRVTRERDVVHLTDVLTDPSYVPEGTRLLGDRGSIVGVPLVYDNDVLGALVLTRRSVQPFSDEEISLARTVSNQAALLIDNARSRDEKHEALKHQRLTADILRILSRSAFDQQSVFRLIVESARVLCAADNATLALFAGGRSRVAANAGEFLDEAAYNAAWADLPLEPDTTTITGRTLLSKGPVHIPDLEAEKGTLKRSVVPATGARSVLAVPLLRDGDVTGTLVVRRLALGRFVARDIRLLETFADQTVIAIENTRLFVTVTRQSEQLARFLSPQVAKLITTDDGAKLLEGHRRPITVLFCDLRGFTSFSETAEPEEVLDVVRQYQAAMGRLIVVHGGTLEHFAGDGMMVFFNDPVPVENHERAATRLAVAMQDGASRLAAGWRKRGYELGLGIGIATGYATLGRIGFEGRYDYGAVGNVVIVASRLSMEAKPGQILVTQRVHAALADEVRTVPLGSLDLKGLTRPVPTYEVVTATTAL